MYHVGDIVETTYYGLCRITSITLDNRYVIRSEEMTAPNGRYNTVFSEDILKVIA